MEGWVGAHGHGWVCLGGACRGVGRGVQMKKRSVGACKEEFGCVHVDVWVGELMWKGGWVQVAKKVGRWMRVQRKGGRVLVEIGSGGGCI